MTSEGESSIKGGEASLGVLTKIFGEGEVKRMERMGRLARCKSIATQLINAKDIPEECRPVLAELRILLRVEYQHAAQDFIQGEFASVAAPAAGAPARADVKRSGLQQFLGVFKWTR